MEGITLLWLSIGLFLAGVFVKGYARELSAVGWIVFGSFWLYRVPVYLDENSAIKIVLAVAALPLSAYVAYHIYTDGRETLLKLSQAVAAMGLIYIPFLTIPTLHTLLIEHTASQTNRAMMLLNIDAELQSYQGAESMFVVTDPATGEEYRTYIILACTGLGAMSIFGGLISVLDAPLRRKLAALVVTFSIIYVLNLIRNVFIATAFGYQWFPFAEETIVEMTGKYEGYASFFWADKVISQSLAVVVLVALLLLVLRFLPELNDLLDDVMELAGVNKTGA